MLPNFIVPETTARETGESAPFPLGESLNENLLLTLGITHAMEHESIDVDILTSSDGQVWSRNAAVSFRQKSYCGTYHMVLPASETKFLKATWRLAHWGHAPSRPFFRFYLAAQPSPVRVMAGAA